MFKSYSFILLLTFILTIPSEVLSQYFGKNNVQYEDFDFKILHTDHFDIYHYPQEQKATKDLGRLAERWYQRHSKMLDHSFHAKNPLIIYANHADFQQTDIISQVSIGTGGVTEGLGNRVIMPFAHSNASTNHVLGHELVHAFQYSLAKTDEIGGIRATSQMPLWFIEGMAEYLSIGPTDAQTAMYLRDAVFYDDMPEIEDLSRGSNYFPYRYGHAVWSFITGTWGDDIVSELYVRSAQGGLETGFLNTLKIPIDSVSTLWRQSVEKQYQNEIEARTAPEEVGKLLRGEENGREGLNVAPSLSPDGEHLAFISQTDLFSLELFLADAETGEIVRTLTSTRTDPHLNAIRFIESSGSWSPDSRRIAVVTFAKGDNRLAIIDAEEGGIQQSLSFDEVDAITNSAWSPDGNRIAFSGSKGGYSDLYLYNLETDSLRQLTDDKYSDMQPTWSPDGSVLAFATDRGPGTSFDDMTIGSMKIALFDMETADVELLPAFYNSKHINPQFSPNGKSLYFISNYGSFNDVYRYDFETDNRYRITDVVTGISGISEFSPAMTVSGKTGEMIVSVFKKSNYELYSIPEDELTGAQVINYSKTAGNNRLPPADADGNRRMISYLNDPLTNLPEDTSFGISDYTPGLRLEAITGGGGIGYNNQLGMGAGGGVNFIFSDMLRQHQLSATLSLQGQIQDVSGQVGYVNRDNRLIWGGSASHRTYRTTRSGLTEDEYTVDGEQVQVLRLDRVTQRVFQDRIGALGLYPFSITQRLESSISFTRISYDYELQQNYLAPGTGQLIERQEEDLQTPDPLNLYSASLAYVQDNSTFAFTGPVAGHRMRLEAEPTGGSLSFVNATADYRKYFFANPVTFAFRLLHYGRYLSGADSDRLSPNFLGYESLIRGYNTASFETGECTETPEGNCAEFERLVGSRVGIANVEFRLPVLGVEDLALFRSRTIPTTFTAFFDGGVAWSGNETPELKWERRSAERIPVFSAGVSFRVNILGYLITEIYYAVPFQRPEKGGYIGLHFSPGW